MGAGEEKRQPQTSSPRHVMPRLRVFLEVIHCIMYIFIYIYIYSVDSHGSRNLCPSLVDDFRWKYLLHALAFRIGNLGFCGFHPFNSASLSSGFLT